jgi:YfiR/HmsC-like
MIPVAARTLPMLLVMGLVWTCVPASLSAEPAPVPEYNAKAGYLVAFQSYVTWPAGALAAPTSPVVLCVLGRDPFGAVLDETAAARVGARPLQVRRIHSPNDAGDCQIVFIGKAESAREAEWLAAIKRKPILTVGESGKTVERGGAVEFGAVRDRVAFEVSLPAAEQAGLKISSDMLAHARKVYR